ncbi:MAG: outer membrane protein-like protein [Mucilaginibacter sp.]|nr:outer membrane protein-like protein [Mucilaginibacter sp.]
MKTSSTLFLIGCLLSFITACNNGAGTDSKAKADSINKAGDSFNNKTPHVGIQLSGADSKFAVEAANGGMAEVVLGKLAQEKAASQQVKEFGAMMVTDHSKANAEFKQIAAAKKITLPDSIGADEQKVVKELSAKSGGDFDKAYVQDMIDDHKKDIQTFEDAGKQVKYPEVLAFVNKTLPVLKMHLAAIQKIHDQMK